MKRLVFLHWFLYDELQYKKWPYIMHFFHLYTFEIIGNLMPSSIYECIDSLIIFFHLIA